MVGGTRKSGKNDAVIEHEVTRFRRLERAIDDLPGDDDARCDLAAPTWANGALYFHVPGCEAKGFTLDDARYAAVSALVHCIRENGLPHHPMDVDVVQRSEEWLSQRHIDLSRAVVSTVPLAA